MSAVHGWQSTVGSPFSANRLRKPTSMPALLNPQIRRVVRKILRSVPLTCSRMISTLHVSREGASLLTLPVKMQLRRTGRPGPAWVPQGIDAVRVVRRVRQPVSVQPLVQPIRCGQARQSPLIEEFWPDIHRKITHKPKDEVAPAISPHS